MKNLDREDKILIVINVIAVLLFIGLLVGGFANKPSFTEWSPLYKVLAITAGAFTGFAILSFLIKKFTDYRK